MRKKKIKRFSRHQVIVALSVALVVGIVGFLGVNVFQKSSDAAAPLGSRYCRSLGRVFDSGTCRKACQAGAGSLRTGNRWDYCSNAASAITGNKCNQLHRVYIADKCLKAWTQSPQKSPIAPCQDGYFRYKVGNPYDKCTPERGFGVWS